MKMIEVFDLMAKKGIEHETQLIIYYESVGYVYKYHKLYRTFLNDDSKRMEEDFVFGDDFLNFDVKLIPPKPKKYYLRLSEDDKFSYINRNVEYHTCKPSSRSESFVCKTKFTQEEINNDKFLKFIEQHGIKEEVEG